MKRFFFLGFRESCPGGGSVSAHHRTGITDRPETNLFDETDLELLTEWYKILAESYHRGEIIVVYLFLSFAA